MYDVSMIVPVYNTSKYLNECLESIVNQEGDKFEVILIDDGSTDNSGKICDDFCDKNSNFKVYHIENGGVAHARKIGIEKSTGKYIMFIDSDDWIESKMVKTMYEKITQNDVDVVCCEYYSEESTRTVASKSNIENDKIYTQREEIIKDILTYKGIYVWMVNKIFKRSLFVNIDYMIGVSMGEDYRVLLQVIGNASTLQALSNHFYHYRQNENSACHTNFCKYIDNWNMALKNADLYGKIYPGIRQFFYLKVYIEEIGGLVLMCRSGVVDKNVCKKVQKDIRKNLFKIIITKGIQLKYKMSAICISISARLFCGLYIAGFKAVR